MYKYLLLLLLFVSAVSLAQQLPSQQSLSVAVSYANLTYLVYRDGAVQPLYNASLSITIHNFTMAGGLALSGFENFTKSLVVGGYVLKGLFQGGWNSTYSFDMSFRWGGNYSNGLGAYLFGLTLIDNSTPVALTVKARSIGAVMYFTLNVSSPGIGAQQVPTPQEVNSRLAEAGVDYINVTSIKAGAGYIQIGGVLYVDKAAERISTSDKTGAEALRELLTGNYTAQGAGRADVEVEARGRSVAINGSGSWHVEGDVERAYALLDAASGAITLLTQQISVGLSAAVSGTSPPLAAAAPPVVATPLAVKPPSAARVDVMVEARPAGNSTVITIDIAAVGHRVGPLNSTGDPARDAEIALSYESMGLSNVEQMMPLLSMMMPGIQYVVPSRVEVKPASPDVSVQPSVVGPLDLPRVVVTVVNATKTQISATTSVTSTTQTSTTTAASTSTPTSPASTAVSTTTASTTTSTTISSASTTSSNASVVIPRTPNYIPWTIAVAIVVIVLTIVLLTIRKK
ncbi:MAG: hypothetical protein QXP98_02105 [Thermoproteus sp.]